MTDSFLRIYPPATMLQVDMGQGRDKFLNGRPVGVTVHYTADRKLQRVVKSLQEKNLAYHLFITRGGEVIQAVDFETTTNHAGNALWNGHSPNKTHVSISLVSWGQLEMDMTSGYKAWNGAIILPSEVRGKDNKYWDRCTDEQEKALLDVLRWFVHFQGIDPKNICGHDECAIPKGRKVDPGSVLSMTMQELRDRVQGGQSGVG